MAVSHLTPHHHHQASPHPPSSARDTCRCGWKWPGCAAAVLWLSCTATYQHHHPLPRRPIGHEAIGFRRKRGEKSHEAALRSIGTLQYHRKIAMRAIVRNREIGAGDGQTRQGTKQASKQASSDSDNNDDNDDGEWN